MPRQGSGILGEEAEDQPRHEVVHVMAALGFAPLQVVLQEFDIEPIHAARRPDVERVLLDLLNRGDPGKRKEEAEVIREVAVSASYGLGASQVLGLEIDAVSREDELRLCFRCRGAAFQCAKRLRDAPRLAGVDMNVAGLENATEIRPVRRPGAKVLDRLASLLPKASRKVKGKFAASNGCSASSEIASSISTAFNRVASPHVFRNARFGLWSCTWGFRTPRILSRLANCRSFQF